METLTTCATDAGAGADRDGGYGVVATVGVAEVREARVLNKGSELFERPEQELETNKNNLISDQSYALIPN